MDCLISPSISPIDKERFITRHDQVEQVSRGNLSDYCTDLGLLLVGDVPSYQDDTQTQEGVY